MLEAFNTQFWHDVVWALLHSIWQATIIALLLGFILRQISAKHASLRYWISAIAIFSVVLSSFFTYHVRAQFRNLPTSPLVEQTSSYSASTSTLSDLPAAELATTSTAASNMGTGINWTAIAALFWVIGVSVMVLRTIGAVFNGNQRSSVTPIESSKHLELLKLLSNKLGLRSVPSFWSSTTSLTPYAVGFLAPAIVVPISMLTNLNAMELQAVLAHELAHIRRNDYLANLFQMVIEAVYFFNPALWWISRQIRIEREACCDQVAIESSSNRVGYATILANWMESLADSSETPFEEAPSASMAFSQKQPSSMLERIQRILKPDAKPHLRVSTMNLVFVVAASLLIACVFNAGSKAVTVAAAQVLSHSDRVEKIEEVQSNVTTPKMPFEKGMTTIRGRITTEDGGEVERGIIYSSTQYAEGTFNNTECKFEANQELEFPVHSGIVWLSFFCKNYAPTVVGPIEAVKDQSFTKDVTLVKGKPHLVHVVDEAGQPIAGADVRMFPLTRGGPVWKTTTDEMGNYTFKHRRPGKQSNLRVEKVGYITHRAIVLNEGKTDVTLKTSPISKGVVLAADGTPVADAEIRVDRIKENSRNFFLRKTLVATTDQKGRFETPTLSPTGVHQIFIVSDRGMAVLEDVTASDDLKFTLNPPCSTDITIKGDLALLKRTKSGKVKIDFHQQFGHTLWYGDWKKNDVEVLEDSKEQIRLKLKRLIPGQFWIRSGKFEYAGRATPGDHSVELISAAKDPKSKPVNNEVVEVQIQFQSNGKIVKPSGGIRTGYQGNRFLPLSDGELKVNLTPRRHYLKPEGLIGFTFGRDESINVEAGRENKFVVDVEPAGAVSGRVIDADGEPVSGTVSCWYVVSTPRKHGSYGLFNHFKSDSDGKFLLTPVPVEATRIIVTAMDRVYSVVSDELSFEKGNPLIDVQLQIPRPTESTARVVDLDGKPIPGVELAVSSSGRGGGGGRFSTNAKGECKILSLHPDRKYQVTARAKKGFIAETVEMMEGETAVLQLKPGCIVRGRVVDKDGKPAPKEQIYAVPVDKDLLPLSHSRIRSDRDTDADGQFEFTRLPKGEFQITRYGAEPVIVDAGVDDQPIEIQLEE